MNAEKSESVEVKHDPDEGGAAQGDSVVARLIDLRARLKGIGDALTSRHHTAESQSVEVEAPSDGTEELANLERRMAELGVATQAVVDEIRERPAYDPGDVQGLIDKLDAWRREKTQADRPAVASKTRPVDRLSEAEHLATFARIQDELGELTEAVSTRDRSGLDLAGLQQRLAEVGEMLASMNGISAATPNADVGAQADPAQDAAGAFDALQSALGALVEQAGSIAPAEKERPVATAGDTPGPQRISAEAAKPSGNAFLRRPARSSGDAGAETASPAAASAALAAMIDKKQEGVAADAQLKSTGLTSADASPADGSSRIGRFFGWRKAKAAIVTSKTPEY